MAPDGLPLISSSKGTAAISALPFRPGMKIAMTMPSLRQTVKDSAAASKIIDTAVAIAAPHRPSIGMSTTLSAMLRASVSA